MDFLVVSDSKLKIMMSREDMKKYEIDGDNIDYDDPKVRRSFWRILDAAREACGFEASGDKVLIQFYPSKEGSEIFVTKLGLISSGAERTIVKSSKVAMLTTKRSIYKFSSFSSLVIAAKIISRGEYEGQPRAYFDERGFYYLIADERRGYNERASDISAISEYGGQIPENLASYISEHSNEIKFDVLKQL
ncbi:MAG: adaptor protein MecA [Clostridia bacterium]|nr:adaptor protein MecA [Clostridia bacterium]